MYLSFLLSTSFFFLHFFCLFNFKYMYVPIETVKYTLQSVLICSNLLKTTFLFQIILKYILNFFRIIKYEFVCNVDKICNIKFQIYSFYDILKHFYKLFCVVSRHV